MEKTRRRVERTAVPRFLKRVFRRILYGPVCAIEYEWSTDPDLATCDRCRCSEEERSDCAYNI